LIGNQIIHKVKILIPYLKKDRIQLIDNLLNNKIQNHKVKVNLELNLHLLNLIQ